MPDSGDEIRRLGHVRRRRVSFFPGTIVSTLSRPLCVRTSSAEHRSYPGFPFKARALDSHECPVSQRNRVDLSCFLLPVGMPRPTFRADLDFTDDVLSRVRNLPDGALQASHPGHLISPRSYSRHPAKGRREVSGM